MYVLLFSQSLIRLNLSKTVGEIILISYIDKRGIYCLIW